jgi:hypothetical protein
VPKVANLSEINITLSNLQWHLFAQTQPPKYEYFIQYVPSKSHMKCFVVPPGCLNFNHTKNPHQSSNCPSSMVLRQDIIENHEKLTANKDCNRFLLLPHAWMYVTSGTICYYLGLFVCMIFWYLSWLCQAIQLIASRMCCLARNYN